MAALSKFTIDLLAAQGVTIGLLPVQTAFDADRLTREAMTATLRIVIAAAASEPLDLDELRRTADTLVAPFAGAAGGSADA